ncbi:MAG: hypothetical protein ACYDAE_23165 [Steroidobacteraceae bacterium]
MATTAITLLSPDTPTWTAVPNGNQGGGWQMRPSYRTAWFTATGTWGAAGSVQLEGSNDGTNWFKLSPAALTAAGSFAALGVTEVPKYIRPNVTAGDGTTAITVIGSALDNE